MAFVKTHKNSNFDQNQLKFFIHLYVLEKITKMENSLLAIFDKLPCTIVQDVLSNFGVTLKIHKNQILIGIS